ALTVCGHIVIVLYSREFLGLVLVVGGNVGTANAVPAILVRVTGGDIDAAVDDVVGSDLEGCGVPCSRTDAPLAARVQAGAEHARGPRLNVVLVGGRRH